MTFPSNHSSGCSTGQAVDLGRVDAPVDGARHERQAARPGGIVVLRHERGGGQRLHARLADGDHVRARADHAEELDEVVRVAVEAERAGGDGDLARVVPVGQVDVVLGEHRPHGRAQQCGEVPRHGRDEQDRRLGDVGVLLEVQKRAERGDVGRALRDRDLLAPDERAVDAERGTRVREAPEGHELGGRGRAADEREVRQAARQMGDRIRQDRRRDPEGRHEIGLRLIGRVEHASGTLISVVDRSGGHL